MTASARRLLLGTDEAVAASIVLRAGRLVAQLRGTRLGPVMFDGHELWHGVDFRYRNPDWGTPVHLVNRVDYQPTAEGFRVRIEGHVEVGTGLSFEIAIEASERHLNYSATSATQADLATSRTGLVLLHSLSVCGRRLDVEHIDGRISHSTFPTLIAPWPPFMLVRGIRHEYADGVWATSRFDGGDFELEDQRNNADASFKTYYRSNLMPRPYLLRADTPLRQSVQLQFDAPPAPAAPRTILPVTVRVGNSTAPLPAIGPLIDAAELRATPGVRAALKDLAPGLLHLVLDDPHAQIDITGLRDLLDAANGCALHLHIGAVTSDAADTQLGGIAGALRSGGMVPAAVACSPGTPVVLQAARHAFAGSAVGSGSAHFFTQLNRIEDLGATDFLCFGTSSVVHGADDDEIMLGLQSLPAMVQTLHAVHGPKPVHVGPSSIGARRSPLGAQPASDGTRRLALARRDPRTSALYGAAWALGYVAQFAQAGVRAITLFDLHGDAPLVRGDVTTPAYQVLRRINSATLRRGVYVGAPGTVAALALDGPHGRELLVANLGCEPVDLLLDGMAPRQAWVMDVEALQAQSVHGASYFWRSVSLSGKRLRLAAYAIASV